MWPMAYRRVSRCYLARNMGRRQLVIGPNLPAFKSFAKLKNSEERFRLINLPFTTNTDEHKGHWHKIICMLLLPPGTQCC